MATENNANLTYTFYCYGHSAIRATHVKTLEFTKDTQLTERGDCIVGINADFERHKLKQFEGKIKVTCGVESPSGEVIESVFKCKVNPQFDDDHEVVLRKSGFQSQRTFGLGLNRGANWLDRRIVELLQNPTTKMHVTISAGWL